MEESQTLKDLRKVIEDYDRIYQEYLSIKSKREILAKQYMAEVAASETTAEKEKKLEFWVHEWQNAVATFGVRDDVGSLPSTTFGWVNTYREALGMPPLTKNTRASLLSGEGVKVDIGCKNPAVVYQDGTVVYEGKICKPSYGRTTVWTFLPVGNSWRAKCGGKTLSIAKLLCDAFHDDPNGREVVRIEILGDPKSIPTRDTIRPIFDGEPYNTQEKVDETNASYKALGKRLNEARDVPKEYDPREPLPADDLTP